MYYLGRRENKLIYVKAIIVRVNFESLYGKYADTYETFLSLRENSAPRSLSGSLLQRFIRFINVNLGLYVSKARTNERTRFESR